MSELVERLQQALADRYRIERELGSGGMGTVYEVYDAMRGEAVALKALHWADASAIYRFKKEFRTLADVSHTNVVQLHELVARDDLWFFTMELVEGQDFLTYVRPGFERGRSRTSAADMEFAGEEAVEGTAHEVRSTLSGGTLDLARLRPALKQLIQGVAALHAAQIVHRDLKPTNVLVTTEGRVVILDFGIAAEIAPSQTLKTVEDGVSGTVEYMSPEQCAGSEPTPASDWYSVGVLLYEALAGRLPFTGAALMMMMEKQLEDPPSPAESAPDLPGDLVGLCVSLMARNPADRPTDDDLRARLGLWGSAAVVDRYGQRAEGAPLVGRAEELARLHEAFEAVGTGRPVSVCVYGPSGIGKTTLVRHFTRELSAGHRAVVLFGRCFVRETVPYKALDGVMDMLSKALRAKPEAFADARLPADAAALARLFPVLRRVEAIERRVDVAREIPDPRELRRRAFAALRELLQTLSQQRPLVLHIDDLQWADRDSAEALSDLLGIAAPARLLFMLCFRSEDVSGTPFLRDLLRQATTSSRCSLELGPLTMADAVNYAMQMLDTEEPSAEARAKRLARESGGNPFLLDQMVQVSLEGEGESLGLAGMLAARLRQMPPGARELVEVLAVAGQTVNAGVAYRAASLEGDERRLITSLRLAHLVRASASEDQIDLYHDKIRETVTHELLPPRTRAIHRRLVEELEAAAVARPESLYEHCLGAGDHQRAAAFAAQAAAEAQAALAFERAALFYRRALDLSAEPGPRTASWLVSLGDALATAGRGGEAARAYLEAVPMLDSATALEIERRAGQQLLLSGHLEEGLAVIGRVLAKANLPRFAPSPRRALLELLLRRVRVTLRGLAYRERGADAIPADVLTRIDTCWAVAEGMGMIDNIRGAAFQALHLLLALDAGEPTRIGRALAIEASYASSTGDAARAARLLRDAERLAQRPAGRGTLGLCRMASEVSALHDGRFEDAARLATEAEALLSEQRGLSCWPLNVARIYHIAALHHEGRIRELCRLTRAFHDDALDRGDRFAATMVSSSFSLLLWLCADDLEGARTSLAEAEKLCPEGVFYVPHVFCLQGRAMVELYAQNGESAYRHIAGIWPVLTRSEILRVEALGVMCLWARASCAIAAARVSSDPAPLLAVAQRDAALLRRTHFSMIYTRDWPLMFNAAIASVRGEREAALAHLDHAMDGFREDGAAFLSAVARRRKGGLLGGGEGRALMAEADEWMRSEGIVSPARLAEAYAPGFPDGTLGDS